MDSERAVPVIRFVDGQRRVGSGYRIAQRFVLTAAHCVTGSGHRVWLADGERRVSVVADGGRLSGSGSAGDHPDAQAGEAAVVGVPPTPCARVDRGAPGKLGDCVAVGYPAARRPPGCAVHHCAGGWLDPHCQRSGGYCWRPPVGISGAQGGGFSAARAAHHRNQLGKTPWAGMSGAAVFALGRLVGVVAEHHLPEGDGSLTVVPIDWADRVQDRRGPGLDAQGAGSRLHRRSGTARTGPEPARRWASVLPDRPAVLVERPDRLAALRQALLAADGAAGAGGWAWEARASRCWPPELARAVRDGRDAELAAAYPAGVAWVTVGRERAGGNRPA